VIRRLAAILAISFAVTAVPDRFGSVDDGQLAAEQRARVLIDRQLTGAGWSVQGRKDLNLFAGQGVAVRETIMKPGHGRTDYLLYVDRRAVGVIEAKPEGTPLSGVEWQSAMYAEGLPAEVRLKALTVEGRLPFVFEASGSETHLTNGFDPEARARRVFAFPRPETLARSLRDAEADPAAPTWRAKVKQMPQLHTEGLRPAQIEAVTGIERSLAEQRFDRSLVQMATGAGKTYTAVTSSYRLLKHGGFRRVLFLVDRNNLGDQTLREFQDYATPDDGRRFTELYNVDKLTGAGMVGSSHVVISTIQRVYAGLRGQQVADVDDPNIDDYTPDAPVEVVYNAQMPPEAFDLVIVDEAHRSIYGVWRGVLEYFDAHVVGLTATPVKQTFGFFQQNLVSEYTYAQSVADNVNVDFDVYRIQTQITDQGSTVDAGTIVPVRDRRTRRERYETLDDDLSYTATQLDRAVTSRSQLRLVLETFRDRLFTEIFPGRSTVPKTLIFAKDDNHAEEVLTLAREVFGKGNDFAAKITYSARDPKGLLQQFRTSPSLRIAVTVDMIATGTDVKPLECVFFLRDVRSASYFEQMKGRGARTISNADFQSVTPDAATKTRFVLVDAIGVTEHDYVDACPLERAKGISLKKLLDKAAALTITEDETARWPRGWPSSSCSSPRPSVRSSTRSPAARSRTWYGHSSRRSTPTSSRKPSPMRPSSRASSMRRLPCSSCWTTRYGRSRRTPHCGSASWRCGPATTRSSTRSASTCCWTRAGSSTSSEQRRSSSPGVPTFPSTATRSPPCTCSTHSRGPRACPLPSCANSPSASTGRPTTGHPTSSGTPTPRSRSRRSVTPTGTPSPTSSRWSASRSEPTRSSSPTPERSRRGTPAG